MDFSIVAPYLKLMIKVLIIVIISELTSNICKDNGSSTLAYVIELSTKIIVLAMVFPLFESIIKIVTGLVK